MFGNFIYFIIILLIYTTYQPSEQPCFSLSESLKLFAFFSLIYSLFTYVQFRILERKVLTDVFSRLDLQFNRLQTRQSVIAVILFILNIYLLNLPDYMAEIPFLRALPTIRAVFFLLIFIFYLSVIWFCAHTVYRKLYSSTISRNSYIFSNISFAVPVLLPWLMLSGIQDIIGLLPFEKLKQFLESTEGEILYFLVFLFAVALTGPYLIQKFWGCRPLEQGYMRSRIEALCRYAGLEYADILYWPVFEGRMITAGVMGLVKKFRYILVTQALLDVLRPEEIDAVIAHEIGHVKRRHLLFYLFFFVGYMLISYATFDLILYFIIYTEPLYRIVIQSGISRISVTSAIFTVSTLAIFLIYFRYIFGYFMRNFERQADCYVYRIFDSARPLIRTFEKITYTSGQSADKPNWHHFSIAERIAYIMKCENDRSWIYRQDRKIRRSIAVYLAGIIMIGFFGYSLNFGETGKKISADFFAHILEREIAKKPDDPELYSLLGDLYYSRKEYEKTIAAYSRSLDLKGDSPQALNNLAWLYATCENSSFRNKEKALQMALRAAEISDAAHVLDTLAESYYVNGMYAEAVKTEERALERAGNNRVLYENQLKKFKRAAKRIN